MDTFIPDIENILSVRTHPDDIIKDLSLLQDSINTLYPHLRRDIISFRYRAKWNNNRLDNHSKLLYDISSLYDIYTEIKDSYNAFIDKYRGRDLILYRGVYSSPSYDVLNWKVGYEIQQVVPMSTSIYIDSPLLHSDTDDNTGVLICLRIPIDHNFLCIFTDSYVAHLSRDETKRLFKEGRLDSEITLFPGTMKLDSVSTIQTRRVYHMAYRPYSYSQWIDEYSKYRP